MRAITLRNIPAPVARAIIQRAGERKISLNRAVISLLEERFGAPEGGVTYHDLDDLAGSWAREEAAEFDAVLREQRTIDADVWR